MKIIFIYSFLFAFWVTNTIGFSLTGIKGLSLSNLSFYLLLLVWAYNIAFKRKLLVWNSVNTYVSLLIFVVVLSIPYKILLDELPYINLKQDLIMLKNWGEQFIVFFILLNITDDRKTCNRAIFGLVILLFITALSTPLVSYNIINLGQEVRGYGRASGFGGVNGFASYLVLFIPLVLTFVIFHKSFTIRIYSSVVFLATLVALLTTGSRGGILSFAASMFGYLILLYSQKLIRLPVFFYIVIAVLLFGAASFVAAPSRVVKSFSHRIAPSESEGVDVEKYSAGRFRIWRQSISLFFERPIFGHGHNSIIHLMESQFGLGEVAHNQYLNYLVEFGIIGCILFILIFLKIFHVMWNFMKISPDLWEKKLYIGFVAGLLGWTSSMLFVNLYQVRLLFWFYTAVFLRYGQLHEIVSRNKT